MYLYYRNNWNSEWKGRWHFSIVKIPQKNILLLKKVSHGKDESFQEVFFFNFQESEYLLIRDANTENLEIIVVKNIMDKYF